MARKKRGFGQLRRLPSKRWQAFFTGPDATLHYAPYTFESAEDGEAWLATERRLISRDEWVPPSRRSEQVATPPALTFGEYAATWLAERDLKPRTRAHYRNLLSHQILPHFKGMALTSITPATVREWYAALDKSRPTLRAHAYGLLRTILGTAVIDEHMAANPCHIRGAGNAKRVKRIEPATLPELEAITEAMPQRYRLMVLFASWCGLRFGELVELRRKDVAAKDRMIRIRRGAVRTGGEVIIGSPKSAAGTRDVAIPPHLMPMVEHHLDNLPTRSREQLLFPAADGASTMAPSSLYRVFYRARDAAGRPDLRWHDLRHTGAVLAAQSGATLAELMARLGHSTPQAALRYQHAARGRDAQIAAALSRLAAGPRQAMAPSDSHVRSAESPSAEGS